MFKFTSQSLCCKCQGLESCIEERVIFFSHLLLRPSHRNLPPLNIVLLLACAVSDGPVAPNSDMLSRHARVKTDTACDTLHVPKYTSNTTIRIWWASFSGFNIPLFIGESEAC